MARALQCRRRGLVLARAWSRAGPVRQGPERPSMANAVRSGGLGFGTTFAWSLDAGGRLVVFRLKTFVSPGHRALVGSFYVFSAAPCRRPPRHLGTGPAAPGVRCITLWPRLLQWPPRLLLNAPSKLRKIKHLHRKRGATHYRGQKPRRGESHPAPRTADAGTGQRTCGDAGPGR